MLSYTKPRATLQQVLQKQYQSYDESTNLHVQKVLQRLRTCRTPLMGYHVYRCSDDDCGHIKYQYHSCRDRHCPNCGAVKKQEWIEARMQELLPVKYYHVVFTLPHELNSLVMGHRRLLYKLLFEASSQTLLSFAKDPRYLGAMPGIISVLHTWGQCLSFHPHIHCIVSGGGIIADDEWRHAKKNSYRFLFPVKAMSIVYRAKFLEALRYLIDTGEVILPGRPTGGSGKTDAKQLLDILYKKDWIVYAKAPLAGPHAVIEYLGRYTHKVAISNHRIMGIDEQANMVAFAYKDYADGNIQKQMELNSKEFIRRFTQHILPKGYTKIRTYGYLANRNRRNRINAVLAKMNLPLHKGLAKIPIQVRLLEQYGINITQCPCCNQNTMQLLLVYQPWKKGDDG
ncbi:MAG: IS91 family transposase [Chitinophagaceae bacterium]|nr:IS91 family transposase [Chitinophagaceae bacterium]